MTTPREHYETPSPERRFRITGELSLGSILHTLVLAGATAAVFVFNTGVKTDNTSQHLAQVEAAPLRTAQATVSRILKAPPI